MNLVPRISGTTCGILLGALLIAVVCGCSEPMKIRSAYGAKIPLSGFGPSFDWLPRSRKRTGDYRADNPELHSLIQGLMESEFAAKGYEKQPTGVPGFWVDYYVARKRTGEALGASRYVEYEEGSLIIDVVDPQTRQLMWRGSAQAKLNDTDPPSARQAKIRQAVRGILKRFPSQDKQ